MKKTLGLHNNFISNSIRNKILVPMLLLSLIPIFIFGVIFLNNTYTELEDKKILELQNALELKNDRIKNMFEGIDREIQFIITDTSFTNNIDISSENKILLNNKYRDRIDFLINSQPAIEGVRVANQFDNYYLYYDSLNINEKYYTEFLSEITQSSSSEPHFSKMFVDEHEKTQMFVAYPTHERNSNFIFLIELNVAYVYSVMVDQSAIGKSGEILVAHNSGNAAEFIHDLKYDVSSSTVSFSENRAFPIQEAVQGISGCGSSVDYRFEPIFACWGPTSVLDWGIVAKIDQKEVFESLNYNIMIFLLILFSTSILIIIFSHKVSKGIQNPILELKNSFKEFNGGKYDSIVKAKGYDEIADLTKSFQTFQEYFQTNNKIKIFYQKELELKLDELKKTDILKDEFASMVTHELKTPLTPIRGYCEMLKDNNLGVLTDEQVECIETIDSNASQLEQLIGDILDAQKLDMGYMTFNKTSIQLASFMSDLNKNVQPLIKQKNIKLNILSMVDCELLTDEQRLRQVFYNLIRNAIDFVPKNDGVIEVGFTSFDNELIFYVKDNGIGIPKEKQSNIFKKFYQVNTAQTRKHGGTGLGLVISKGVVEGLGGKIWFESDENEGTTFYFSHSLYSSVTVEAQ